MQKNFQIQIQDSAVQVKLIEEARNGHRISFGKKGLIIRLNKKASQAEKQKHLSRFLEWARIQVSKKPDLLQQHKGRVYTHGMHLYVLDKTFQIFITHSNTESSSARLKGMQIFLQLSKVFSEEDRQLQAGIMVSRCMGNYFLPFIKQRIHDINTAHFHKPIKQIRMKNNASNWGSCSHTGNINISTRLLLAPLPVVDYVLVHELAHLVEFNHGPAFWNLVGNIMPDYEQQESWLKHNGSNCYF